MGWILVDDGAVFEMSQVEHPDTAVCSHTGEHVPASASLQGEGQHKVKYNVQKTREDESNFSHLAEGDVVDLLVVGNELCFDVS